MTPSSTRGAATGRAARAEMEAIARGLTYAGSDVLPPVSDFSDIDEQVVATARIAQRADDVTSLEDAARRDTSIGRATVTMTP